MEQERDDRFNDSPKDTTETGRDLPDGDGTVSDEDIQAINEENQDRPTGQDHSTENYAEQMPDSGVGAIQDASDTTSDIARIDEE